MPRASSTIVATPDSSSISMTVALGASAGCF
jgi:hypothetical protein